MAHGHPWFSFHADRFPLKAWGKHPARRCETTSRGRSLLAGAQAVALQAAVKGAAGNVQQLRCFAGVALGEAERPLEREFLERVEVERMVLELRDAHGARRRDSARRELARQMRERE